LSNSKICSWN